MVICRTVWMIIFLLQIYEYYNVKGRQWKKFSIVIKQFQNPGKTYLITSSVLIYIPVRGTLYSINLYMVKLLITIRRFPPDIPGFYTI